MTNLTLTKKYKLSMRHYIPTDSFGFSSRPHGHDFQVCVSLKQDKNVSSNEIVSRDQLDRIMEKEILQPMESKLINDFMPSGTVENLGECIISRLLKTEIASQLFQVEITETRKNAAQFYPIFSSDNT